MRKEDWADRLAQHFQISHAKFCQGENASREREAKWRAALAATFRKIKRKKGK